MTMNIENTSYLRGPYRGVLVGGHGHCGLKGLSVCYDCLLSLWCWFGNICCLGLYHCFLWNTAPRFVTCTRCQYLLIDSTSGSVTPTKETTFLDLVSELWSLSGELIESWGENGYEIMVMWLAFSPPWIQKDQGCQCLLETGLQTS